jgi:hypothetical protein
MSSFRSGKMLCVHFAKYRTVTVRNVDVVAVVQEPLERLHTTGNNRLVLGRLNLHKFVSRIACTLQISNQ